MKATHHLGIVDDMLVGGAAIDGDFDADMAAAPEELKDAFLDHGEKVPVFLSHYELEDEETVWIGKSELGWLPGDDEGLPYNYAYLADD